jgi:hypothetical protein
MTTRFGFSTRSVRGTSGAFFTVLRAIATWRGGSFLAPVPHRGTRNEPARVARVAEVIAELRGERVDAIASATGENFDRLFAP